MTQGNRSALNRMAHEDVVWSGVSVLRPAAAPSQESAFLAIGPSVCLQPQDGHVFSAITGYDVRVGFEITDVFDIFPTAPEAESSDEETFAAMDAARATAEKELIARTDTERSARRFVRK